MKLNARYAVHVLVFCVSAFYLAWLEMPYGIGDYIQPWTSDTMMQTLTVSMLLEHPLESLWYLHIQPPMLDVLRAIIVQMLSDTHPDMLLAVTDYTLYKIWIIFFAAQVTLIYHWGSSLVANRVVAFLLAMLWMLHPAPVAFATLLEGTFLSSLLITWYFYELWRLSPNRDAVVPSLRLAGGGLPSGSIVRLCVVVLLLFFTRTVFQWYFLPVFLLSLLLLKVPVKQVLVVCVIVGTVMSLHVMKQLVLFDTTSTTTYQGYHLCGMTWYKPTTQELQEAQSALSPFHYPEGAKHIQVQHNTERTYRDNRILTHICRERFFTEPQITATMLLKSFVRGVSSFAKPSSRYTENHIVDSLPQRKYYDRIFSKTLLIVFVLIACLLWMRRARGEDKQTLHGHVALFLPWLFIFLTVTVTTSRYEWVEANRMKFFLEPVIYLFVIAQFARGVVECRMPKCPA